MRAAILVAGLLLLLPSPVHASPEGEVLALENAFTSAIVKRDRAAIERFLDPGMVYSENDATLDRQALLEGLLEGEDRFTEARNEDMQAHAFGDTVIVTGTMVTKGTGKNGPFERRYRFTDTWTKRKGRWMLIAAHDFLAAAGS